MLWVIFKSYLLKKKKQTKIANTQNSSYQYINFNRNDEAGTNTY